MCVRTDLVKVQFSEIAAFDGLELGLVGLFLLLAVRLLLVFLRLVRALALGLQRHGVVEEHIAGMGDVFDSGHGCTSPRGRGVRGNRMLNGRDMHRGVLFHDAARFLRLFRRHRLGDLRIMLGRIMGFGCSGLLPLLQDYRLLRGVMQRFT